MNQLIAAVDLGSNSFRLQIGRIVEEGGVAQIYPVDRMKETVRLAAGLDARLVLDEASIARAVAVLERFGERLRSFHPERVRAVATNTFRVARNVYEFLPRAEAALGFPIEVVAGREEARLIFAGVSHSLAMSPHKRLVVDIGGGSTEVIVGTGYVPELVESLYMGCLSYSRRFFPDGTIDAARMRQAELAARREVEVIGRAYRKSGWTQAYGSSGTAKALGAILPATGLSDGGITRLGMTRLKERLIAAGTVERAELLDIKNDRAVVLPGGLAIMSAIFDELDIDHMETADGALRLGVLYDIMGRDADHDTRDDTVRLFTTRYEVDTAQARRVRDAALSLYRSLVPRPEKTDETALLLGWAADLHGVGQSIAHNTYHRHSAYILAHADMPGFSRSDQHLISLMTLGHQGKLGKLDGLINRQEHWLAVLCLRLSALLFRRGEDLESLPLAVAVQDRHITVRADHEWLAGHPLTDFTLRAEAAEWAKVGFTFEVLET